MTRGLVQLPTISRKFVLLLFGAAAAGALVGGTILSRPLENRVKGIPSARIAEVPAPSLSFASGSGQELTLASFRGKAILLNIWATWCAPCRKEMPSLDRLQSIKGSETFEVVALSIDRGGVSQVETFLKETGVHKLKIYSDEPGASMRALKIVGLPTTLLISEDGRELARWVGPREWNSQAAIAEIESHLSSYRTD